MQVRLFAVVKERVGSEWIDLPVSAAPTVAELKQALVAACPQLQPLARHLVFAVNAEYANDATRIPAGAEVACIPPVSGG